MKEDVANPSITGKRRPLPTSRHEMLTLKPTDLFLAVAITAVWGLNFVVIRVGVDVVPPLMLSAARFLFAAIPMVFLVPRPNIPIGSFLAIAILLGIFSFALLFVGIDAGLSPGIASLVLQSQVFFTAALAVGLLGERMTKHQVLGLFLVIPGILLLMLAAGGNGTFLGLVLVLGAAMTWALSNLFMKQASQVNMLSLMVWVSLVPPIPLIAMSLTLEGIDANLRAIAELGWVQIGAVLYLAYVATLFGFGGWAMLIARHGAGRIAPFSLLVPVFGMASSALFLGETFKTSQLIAAGFIIAGLGLSLWQPARRPITQKHSPGQTSPFPRGAMENPRRTL